MSTPTLYERLYAAGIEMDSHHSDLYVPVTPESREIIEQAKKDHPTILESIFVSDVDGKEWFDLPFEYQPYWEQKNRERSSQTPTP